MARTASLETDPARHGFAPPIYLRWNLTNACDLVCTSCLSSTERPDPRELSTEECEAVIDELQRMRVFHVDVGGGEPTTRQDFWHLLDYAVDHRVGARFCTNGIRITPTRARRLASMASVEVQIAVHGATAKVNDMVRGSGSFVMAWQAMDNLVDAGFESLTISVALTRHNVDQLDAFARMAEHFRAQLRVSRLRPSGCGTDVWGELRPTAEQQRRIHQWLLANGDGVLTSGSFAPEMGLSLCGAGQLACVIDPVGNVYVSPFGVHDHLLAGNVRDPGGVESLWRHSELFTRLPQPRSGGTCTACSQECVL